MKTEVSANWTDRKDSYSLQRREIGLIEDVSLYDNLIQARLVASQQSLTRVGGYARYLVVLQACRGSKVNSEC